MKNTDENTGDSKEDLKKDLLASSQRWRYLNNFLVSSLLVGFVCYLGFGLLSNPRTKASRVDLPSKNDNQLTSDNTDNLVRDSSSEISESTQSGTSSNLESNSSRVKLVQPPIAQSTITPKAKESCGDSVLSKEDYPAVAYAVAADYTEARLEKIQDYYCMDAKSKDGEYIQIASFYSRERAQAFSQKIKSKVGSGYIRKPVWIAEPGKLVQFPIDTCSDIELKVTERKVYFSSVLVPFKDRTKQKIQENLCKEIGVVESGQKIEIAKIRDAEEAKQFASFLKEHLESNEVEVIQSELDKNENDLTVASLKMCEDAKSEDYNAFGQYEYSIEFGDYRGEFSFVEQRSTVLTVTWQNDANIQESIRQNLKLLHCPFGYALVGSDPWDPVSESPSKNYISDIFFGRRNNGKFNWYACDIHYYYVCKEGSKLVRS
ncbi:hypothetical protein U2F10_01715 [Leptothoe sp. EHU-05/26/07-4]